MSIDTSEFCAVPCKVLMNKAPPAADAGENLVELTNRLLDIEYKAVVVYEDKEPIGLVTVKDIMRWLVMAPKREEVMVKDLVSVPLVTVELEAPLQDALDLMEKYSISHIGVHEHKVLRGLLTREGVKEICESYPHYLRQYLNK